jgi:hypothetical protein
MGSGGLEPARGNATVPRAGRQRTELSTPCRPPSPRSSAPAAGPISGGRTRRSIRFLTARRVGTVLPPGLSSGSRGSGGSTSYKRRRTECSGGERS